MPASARSAQGKHIAEGGLHIAAIQADGSVKAAGDNTCGQCNTSEWKNVVAVAAGIDYTLGLKSDGTVYATGNNELGQCNVEEWEDIVMIAASEERSYGFTRDGIVMCTYDSSSFEKAERESLKDIVWMDGLVWYNTGFIDKDGIPHVVLANLGWAKDAVQVYEKSDRCVYILKSDGTVQYIKFNERDQTPKEMDREKWSDIVELDYSFHALIGLKQNGTVIGFLSFEGWEDIVEIEGGFGVRSDGSIIMKAELVNMYPPEQQAEISTWKAMVDPDTLPVSTK